MKLIGLLVPCLLLAQEPRFSRARLETRAAGANFESEFRNLVSSRAEPAWIGYAMASVPGARNNCCLSDGCWGCALEGGRGVFTTAGQVYLEPAGHFVVLFRAAERKVEKIRAYSLDCQLDAGDLPVYWFTGVRAADSLSLLAGFVKNEPERTSSAALGAIAWHADAGADRLLEQYAAPAELESLRRNAIFWLGSARGRPGYDVVLRIAREDSNERIRERAVFALSVSKEPAAVDAMIDIARNDKTPRVRSQALFWLAHKAGAKVGPAISSAIDSDPDLQVKKRAVFALSQLRDEGVPLLIQVARTNRNPEIRKQAMFWLGQSKDPRALNFFEEVLKK